MSARYRLGIADKAGHASWAVYDETTRRWLVGRWSNYDDAKRALLTAVAPTPSADHPDQEALPRHE